MGAFSDFTSYAKETGSRLSHQPLLHEETRHLSVSQSELFHYVTDFKAPAIHSLERSKSVT